MHCLFKWCFGFKQTLFLGELQPLALGSECLGQLPHLLQVTFLQTSLFLSFYANKPQILDSLSPQCFKTKKNEMETVHFPNKKIVKSQDAIL